MRLVAALVVLSSLDVQGLASPRVQDAPAMDGARILAALPLAFERNEGQFAPDVRFVARGSEAIFVLREAPAILEIRGPGAERGIMLRLSGAKRNGTAEGLEPFESRAHYFLGNDPAGWRRGIRSYAKVRYRDVYPGIDVVFYGAEGRLEYDFVVRPGARPNEIRMRFGGHDELRLTTEGHVRLLEKSSGWITQRAPRIYQEERVLVGGYARRGHDLVFDLASHDRSRTLVIDPVIEFSSPIGGSTYEGGSAIAVDSAGNVYVAGVTDSANFPTTGAGLGNVARSDIFLLKLNPSATSILYSVRIGGSGDESGSMLIADDHVYITGNTRSSDFPVVAPVQAAMKGTSDAFVLKLATDGTSISYSTFLGGSGSDFGEAAAVDPAGAVWVTGWTTSTDFPLANPFQNSFGGGNVDGFLAKLSADGRELLVSTYFGGSDSDEPIAIVLGASGHLYLTGRTWSADFPLSNAFQQTRRGPYDAFLAKLTPDARALVFSTYLGGSDVDSAGSLVLDAEENIYLTGGTGSRDFPLAPATAAPYGGGLSDAFLVKFNPTATELLFARYFGGKEADAAGGSLLLAPDGNLYLGGTTASPDFPVLNPLFDAQPGPDDDGFVSSFTLGGALTFSTIIGGSSPAQPRPDDSVGALAAAPDGSLWVAGTLRSDDFPLARPLQARGGDRDAFVMKLVPDFTGSGEMRVVPVVASSPGSLGSFFRTSVQLHNPGSEAIGGRLVFHRQGVAGAEGDPSMSYYLGPGQTREYADLLPVMGQSGTGSIDVITLPGEAPRAVARIFNDAGEAGTTGMAEDLHLPEEALRTGARGVLLAPADNGRFRYNIGVRTLSEGASLAVTVRRSDGTTAGTAAKQYPADYFAQVGAADFLGMALTGNEAIEIAVTAGSAFVYGATTDNTTQDPSAQFARAMVAGSGGSTLVIPVIASAPGAFGSFFRSAVQLHNPYSEGIAGKIVYHAQGTSGGAADPAMEYALGPGETQYYADLLPVMGLSGTGSAELVTTAGGAPVAVIRVFNDAGAAGTTGLMQEPVPAGEVLGAGEQGVLIAPLDLTRSRFNIGVRTLEGGATIEFVVRSASGAEVKRVTKTYGPQFFQQLPAETLLEVGLSGSDSVTARIVTGRAVLYGSTTDNQTQDPSMQLLRRVGDSQGRPAAARHPPLGGGRPESGSAPRPSL